MENDREKLNKIYAKVKLLTNWFQITFNLTIKTEKVNKKMQMQFGEK